MVRVARRILTVLPVLFGVSVAVFLMIRLVPGDVVDVLLGTEGVASPQRLAELRRLFGLDRPFYAQYADWIGRMLAGDLGTSLRTGRPILVGTLTIAESERLAQRLRDRGVRCEVLNARNDAREAAIVAAAGAPSAVTISTNMAGRGTDIRLGGPDEAARDEVVRLGGLYVIGTNRHESARVDRQLRGRAGRQGDPGGGRGSEEARQLAGVGARQRLVLGQGDGELLGERRRDFWRFALQRRGIRKRRGVRPEIRRHAVRHQAGDGHGLGVELLVKEQGLVHRERAGA